MIKPILLFIVGLVCLIKGGDWFVDGASAMARKFHLPELLIGATVVSIGTTLPEVMVSTMSALSGHGEIAYGNAIGSVICNTALIAAITIAVKPGPADPKTLRIPVAFFYIAAAIYCVAAYAMGRFTRTMGLIMLAVFAAYMVVNVRSMKSGAAAAQSDDKEDEPSEEDVPMPKILLLLVLGAALIAVGANLLVENGTLIAQALGVPESVIALTFVALGTSLPELVTAITSLAKGHAGQWCLRDTRTFRRAAERGVHGTQFQSGPGDPGHAAGHVYFDDSDASARKADQSAGNPSAAYLRGILRDPVYDVIFMCSAPVSVSGRGADSFYGDYSAFIFCDDSL